MSREAATSTGDVTSTSQVLPTGVGATGSSGRLTYVNLDGAGGAGSVVVRDGGASGLVLCRLSVLAGDSNQQEFNVAYNNGLHFTITGTVTAIGHVVRSI